MCRISAYFSQSYLLCDKNVVSKAKITKKNQPQTLNALEVEVSELKYLLATSAINKRQPSKRRLRMRLSASDSCFAFFVAFLCTLAYGYVCVCTCV